MALLRILRLSAAGGPIDVEIVIGHAQFGKYELSLYDRDGRHPVLIGAGLSHDQLPDRFQVAADTQVLHGRFLSWSANVIPAGEEAEPQFSVIVHVRQGGIDVAGSPVESRGRLDAPRVEFGFVKLEVE